VALASLTIDGLAVNYGHVSALRDVSIRAEDGQITAVLGANGAGKSTLLSAVMGIARPRRGTIRLDDRDVTSLGPAATARAGIGLVPEGRSLFPSLSVHEHFLLGARKDAGAGTEDEQLERMYDLFPSLRGREKTGAVMLSGGEQQMVAIGRALISRPRVLMLDEPSLGLAPKLVDQVLGLVERLRADGTTIVLVEQNARATLEIADRLYVLHGGRVQASGTAEELAKDDAVQRAYLGA
jgi:branched-chain amino acid transport system ATP-binding protein